MSAAWVTLLERYFRCNAETARSIVEVLAYVTPDWAQALLDRCESPVERLFVVGFALPAFEGACRYIPPDTVDDDTLTSWRFAGCSDDEISWRMREMEKRSCLEITRNDVTLELRPQYEINASEDPWDGNLSGVIARADFAIFHPDRDLENPLLLVEIDGHEFHERTKQQASSDRARDRRLMRCGYRVARFTGGDVHADPAECAREAFDLAHELLEMDELNTECIRAHALGEVTRDREPPALQAKPEAAE